MKIAHFFLLLLTFFINLSGLFAQENEAGCKVLQNTLVGKYTGECKKGLADGKGEAIGQHHYTGSFKKGLPNGKGIYYYNDSLYHSGNFQDGIKEGKGETHFLRAGKEDSVVKGYWSADEFKGSKYITYNLECSRNSDLLIEVNPSSGSGNSVTIEITSITIVGTSPNSILTVTDVIPVNGIFIKKSGFYVTSFKTSVTYELSQFPAKLLATISDGRTLNLEFFKSANWTVKLKVNI